MKNHKEPLDVKIVARLEAFIRRVEHYPKFIRLIIGSILIFLGILMLVLPGPGIVFILTGIAVISKPFGLFLENLMNKYISWRQRGSYFKR